MTVFTYGTLMFDEVWLHVVGRIHPSGPALLAGHRVHKLAGQTFPAMIPARGGEVWGRLWEEVAPTDLEKLDVFESDIYQRSQVTVQKNGEKVTGCWTYLLRDDFRHLLLPGEHWAADEFRTLHLPTYLD